jgi:hypothetical protein
MIIIFQKLNQRDTASLVQYQNILSNIEIELFLKKR